MIGRFKARAVDWQLGYSAKGGEQIAIMFKLVGGEHDGQHLTWFGSFSEAAVDRTLESLRYCGWASDDLAKIDDLGTNEVELDVIEEEYTNPATGETKLRSKVNWVNRPFKLDLKKQMTPADIATFAARLKGKAVASRQKVGAPAPTNGSASGRQSRQGQSGGWDNSAPPPTDDDINF